MASSSHSLFAYDSDSDAALDAVRRENILASHNILAAAMDSSVSKFPFLHGGNSSSAQGVIRMKDMSPAEFATFVDGTIYREFADHSGNQVELTSSSGAAPSRHRSSVALLKTAIRSQRILHLRHKRQLTRLRLRLLMPMPPFLSRLPFRLLPLPRLPHRFQPLLLPPPRI